MLALAALVFLCPSCQEEAMPIPLPGTDISGVWQIRTNDWHKHSAIEQFGQDIFPGTITFDEYVDISSSGRLTYTIDGEDRDEPFAYQITFDTLRVILNRLPENKTATYQANVLSETEFHLSGITGTVDPNTGLMETLTEEMVLIK